MTWQSVLYFLIWAGMFALMMRFGCGAHVMGHGRHRHGEGDGATAGTSGEEKTELSDPVCGMRVSATSAKSAFYQGRPYYFCSSDCRDKFEREPDRYATQSSHIAKEESVHGHHC